MYRLNLKILDESVPLKQTPFFSAPTWDTLMSPDLQQGLSLRGKWALQFAERSVQNIDQSFQRFSVKLRRWVREAGCGIQSRCCCRCCCKGPSVTLTVDSSHLYGVSAQMRERERVIVCVCVTVCVCLLTDVNQCQKKVTQLLLLLYSHWIRKGLTEVYSDLLVYCWISDP